MAASPAAFRYRRWCGTTKGKAMKHALLKATLALLGALSVPAIGNAATVGHYYNCAGQGTAAMANAITTAGHTPVDVLVPNAATLASLDVLWVNHNYGASCDTEWMANRTAIDAAVRDGLVLMVYDRVTAEAAYGTVASVYVPGASAITFVNNYGSNVDIPAGSPLLALGVDNATLDGGSYSAHGHGLAATLPSGSQIWANDGNVAHAVMFSYPLGTGSVVYSSIPLDHYMGGSNNFATILAPASVKAAAGLANTFASCAAEGYTGVKHTLCRQICETPQPPTRLEALITTYLKLYREDPPCARF